MVLPASRVARGAPQRLLGVARQREEGALLVLRPRSQPGVEAVVHHLEESPLLASEGDLVDECTGRWLSGGCARLRVGGHVDDWHARGGRAREAAVPSDRVAGAAREAGSEGEARHMQRGKFLNGALGKEGNTGRLLIYLCLQRKATGGTRMVPPFARRRRIAGEHCHLLPPFAGCAPQNFTEA